MQSNNLISDEYLESFVKMSFVDNNAHDILNKNDYEEGFEKIKEKYIILIENFDESCKEDKEMTTKAICNALVAYAMEKTKDLKKHAKEKVIYDLNFNLVSIVLPLIHEYETDNTDYLASQIVLTWNNAFPKQKITETNYEMINSSFRRKLCYITTAVCDSLNKSDNCEELMLLRNFRDNYLINNKQGVEYVDKYYDIAPTIVNNINDKNNSEKIYYNIYKQYILKCINLIKEKKYTECKQVYEKMVNNLSEEFVYN